METQLLEIILISTQGLKPLSGNLRRMQTCALAWFISRVCSDFLACDTSVVAFEIYAVGVIRDHLIGTVCILISNCLPATDLRFRNFAARSPSLTTVQIRRPSGRFHSILNVAAAVVNASDFASLTGTLAIDHHDLMGRSLRCRRSHCNEPRRASNSRAGNHVITRVQTPPTTQRAQIRRLPLRRQHQRFERWREQRHSNRTMEECYAGWGLKCRFI
ncbi:hypothetical protein CK203_113501 [Vitis vinifera]|uniref:Uncharacterized protein n=1 Tax=Vitis vinifera TaxID=29760 RepID=A0A438FHQ8_VITVI|nr:hypothetical protein CK203_113501 [Vitis vinifera]